MAFDAQRAAFCSNELWETMTGFALPPACVHAYELATLSCVQAYELATSSSAKPRVEATNAHRAPFCSNEPRPPHHCLQEVKIPQAGLPPRTTPLLAGVGPQDDARYATSVPEQLIDAIDGVRVSRMAKSGYALMLPTPAATLHGPWCFSGTGFRLELMLLAVVSAAGFLVCMTTATSSLRRHQSARTIGLAPSLVPQRLVGLLVKTSRRMLKLHQSLQAARPRAVASRGGSRFNPSGLKSALRRTHSSGGGNAARRKRARVSDTAPSNLPASGSTAAQEPSRVLDVVNIMYWNIFRSFSVKFFSDEFRLLLKTYDIMFFAETDLLPGEEEALPVMQGYHMLSHPRNPRSDGTRRGGGLLLLIRDCIQFEKSHLCSADILVLDLGKVWLIGAYVPPGTSRWQDWTDVAPFEKLWETVAICTQTRPVIILADINGRIGVLQVPDCNGIWPRTSEDETENARGLELLDECNSNEACIVNGTTLETTSPGRYTSWQPNGESMIDYAIVSRELMSKVRRLHIETPCADPADEWSDHMRICLTMDASIIEARRRPQWRPTAPRPDFSGNQDVDMEYQAVMDAREDPEQALKSLWGTVSAQSSRVHVYVAGASSKKGSGAAVFFGPGSPRNLSLSVPGPHSQTTTSQRAHLYAIYEALHAIEPDKTLVIYCMSKQIIRDICYKAAQNVQLGWPGSNKDIYLAIVDLLARRHATTCFLHVDAADKNPAAKQALDLAKKAQRSSIVEFESIPVPWAGEGLSIDDCSKVHTELPAMSLPRRKPPRGEDKGDEHEHNSSHRGRAKVNRLKTEMREKLRNAARDGEKAFWIFVRWLLDGQAPEIQVDLENMTDDFRVRLNYPELIPPSFNALRLSLMKILAEDLRTEPADNSLLQSYSREITIEEVQAAKRHIKAHGTDSAVGPDSFSYEDCLSVPNEILLGFFKRCLNGSTINVLAHADDILNASTLPPAFQDHLNDSQHWADDNGCETSIAKCLVQAFNGRRKLEPAPTFQMNGRTLSKVEKAAYLGIWLKSGTHSIWEEQYVVQAQKARRAANIILGLERFLERIDVWQARDMYMAQVDPYLIAGCEIFPDVDAKSLRRLQKVENMFWRRVLGLGARSLTVVLFSETGIWPIQYRRVFLALKYLRYLLTLHAHDQDPARPAWHAVQESIELARHRKTSWILHLRKALSRLTPHVEFNISEIMTRPEMVEEAMKNVEGSLHSWITTKIEESSRVSELLASRVEYDSKTGKLIKKPLVFRHYLRVTAPNHRIALTRFILSSHILAVERRRWKERRKPEVPREWRLCRFCKSEVEDPAHAMFICSHPPLRHLREIFLSKLYKDAPEIQSDLHSCSTPVEFFQRVLANREVTPLLAKHAYETTKIFDATPIYLVYPPANGEDDSAS
ncbi:hypothetical protein C8F01DRAFT_1231043 [Mycena amicta]|nr:hypothetical protein C8F01DRAFT_1231043 [Mycena amicta]